MFHRLPNCFTEVVTLTFCPWTCDRYVARWTKHDESCSFLSNFRDLLLTGYSSTTYIFQSTIHQLPLFNCPLSSPPPKKKTATPFPNFGSLVSIDTFSLSQVSTGLDLVELSETGQWLTTEVLGKGRGPTSIQDRFEAVWCGR